MSNAGLNPQKDMDKQIVINFINVLPIVNSLSKLKGEKPGDGTKVVENHEEGFVKKGKEPIIDATAIKHQMDIDDKKKEAYRTVVVNGKQVQVKLKNYKEIKMKYAEWKKREGIEDKIKDQDAR